MSRVADLLEGWSKDPAYTHDFAALARELEARCTTETPAGLSPRVSASRAKPTSNTMEQRLRLKAKDR